MRRLVALDWIFEQTVMAYVNGSYHINSSECIPMTLGNDSMRQLNASLGPCMPDYAHKQQLKNILSNVLSGLIAFIMVGIGCAIEGKKIFKHIKKPTGVVSGLVCQFVIMPLLGLAWAKLFTMDDPETLSVLIVGSCPGGTMSNIVAYWIGGDMELSSVMTTISVTLSLGTLPLLLYVYSHVIANTTILVPYRAIGLTVVLIVIPLSVGALLRLKYPKVAVKVLKVFSIVGMFALVSVGAVSIYLFHEFWSFQMGQIITAICYPACGMFLGYTLTSIIAFTVPSLKLSHSERRTVSVETGIQNSQLAMMIVQLSGWSLQITGRVVAFPMMYAISQVSWSLLYVLLYHIASYARNGECPRPPGREIEEGSAKLQSSADILNPVFDPRE